MPLFPPEVTTSFSRILIPWGILGRIKGTFKIPEDRTAHCISELLKIAVPPQVFSKGVLSDIGGNQAAPHTICSIEGEVIDEDNAREPFTWEARALFGSFKGLTHLQSLIEHRVSSGYPTILSPLELPLSLPVKINRCVVMMTYYEPQVLRFFGASASAAGSLTISIENSEVFLEATYRRPTQEKAEKVLQEKFGAILTLLSESQNPLGAHLVQ